MKGDEVERLSVREGARGEQTGGLVEVLEMIKLR